MDHTGLLFLGRGDGIVGIWKLKVNGDGNPVSIDDHAENGNLEISVIDHEY
jgi:hypothetical protein